MNIETMINRLESMPIDTPVLTFNQEEIGKHYGCDREDYYDMYLTLLELSPQYDKIETTGDLLDMLYEALSQGEMYGYKGGSYPIERGTNLRMGGYKYLGDPITEVVFEEDVCLIVYQEPDY